jgi:CHAT domain-containing protein/Flp pilus assembly protein TadD
MKNGELLDLLVQQDGVDLQVSISQPDGMPLFTVDSPNGDRGPERALLVAQRSATYQFQVSARSSGGAGRYRIWIVAQHPATARDRKEAEAEKLFHQAKETKDPRELSSREAKLCEARRLWEQTRNLMRQADALRLLGNLYAEQWNRQKALQVRRRAKFLYRQARRFGDEGTLANDIGTLYVQSSDLDAAHRSYVEAQALGARSGSVQVTTKALYGLGYVAWRQGRSAEALDSFERVRAAWRGLDRIQEGTALTAMGGVLADAGKTDLAIAKFQEALAIFESRKNPQKKAITLTQMGNAYVKRRDPEQALHFYRKALEIQLRIQAEADLPATLNGLGLTLLHQNRPQEALEPLLKSLQLARKKTDLTEEARILTNLGWTYAFLGREADARSAYEQALHLARETEDHWMESAALLGLARLEEARGNPIAAQVQAEAAVRSVEDLRAIARPDLTVEFMASQQDVYDALIEILLWLHELRPSAGYGAQALRVSEQARSRGLLDEILESSPAGRMDTKSSTSQILSLTEIQRSVLGRDTLLLEYHLGRKASYLWLIDETFLRIFKLPARGALEPLAQRARLLIAASGRREKQSEARRVAEELSHVLLGPAAPWLGRKRLLISVPDALQSIPFSVLPDPVASGFEEGGRWPRPLILEHEVVKVSSASVLAALRAREDTRTPPQDLLAVLADPVFGFPDERLAGLVLTSSQRRSETPIESFLGHFNRLTHAHEEAESILGEVGKNGVFAAFGFDASRDLVLSGRLRGFRNLHFATHGLLRSDDADLSALVLSLVDPRGRRRNGFLRAADIYELKLPADLVTLSACETGLGERIPGEGLVGLPQAFFAAGATRILVSLWAVNDLATARLMKIFYHEYLKRGLSPAAALREAQKAMWEGSLQHAPFYWGGFEIQGDWETVTSLR